MLFSVSFKAALNVVVAAERALGGPESLMGGTNLITAFARTSIRVGIKVDGASRRGGDHHD